MQDNDGYVVRVVEHCASTLTGGYDGCDIEVTVQSLQAALKLMAVLLERNHVEQLKEGVEYARPRAGGRRTVTLRSAP